MADDLDPAETSAADGAPQCPWCSADLPPGEHDRCPSCGASLTEVAEKEIPGVTKIDHEAILKARAPTSSSRGLLGWLSGEREPQIDPAILAVVAPPDLDVRQEMIRLELAALEAEVEAKRAELEAELIAARQSDPSSEPSTEAGSAEPPDSEDAPDS